MYCKQCGNEISDNVSFCKNCGTKSPSNETPPEPIKSTGTSNIAIGLIAAAAMVGIFLIIGLLDTSQDSEPKETTTISSEAKKVSEGETSSNDKSSEPTNDQKVFNIGEDVQVGEVKWRVNKAPEKMNEIAGSYGKVTAGGVYILIELTAELTGKETGNVSNMQFRLIDDKDRKFEASDDGFSGLMYLDRESLTFKQVNPNVPVTGWVVFDVAEDAKGFKLEIEDLRFLNDDTRLIDIGI